MSSKGMPVLVDPLRRPEQTARPVPRAFLFGRELDRKESHLNDRRPAHALGKHASGWRRWNAQKRMAITGKMKTLASGPMGPPVSQSGPWNVEARRWPGRGFPSLPVFGPLKMKSAPKL